MTELSLKTLASTLDSLVSRGAIVTETGSGVIVSDLASAMTREIIGSLSGLGWRYRLVDGAGNETEAVEIADDFGPFRVSTDKPPLAGHEVLLISGSGFRDWLAGPATALAVFVVGLDHAIATESTLFIPADTMRPADAQPVPSVPDALPLRSPRTLVREYGARGTAPIRIEEWLLKDTDAWNGANSRFAIWADQAARAILRSLPAEIDQNTGAFVFKGPPRLALPPLDGNIALVEELGPHAFRDLQVAGRWVYELERETEMRHSLLATEIARTGDSRAGTIAYLKDNLDSALESAKIAYAMSLAKVSAENLKALVDLRKAVTDETTKITEATRQVVGAVASALAVGIGLIAARVAADAPSILVLAVMTVVCAYIFVVIYSGHKFADVHRSLRDVWRGQIYHFLSAEDYTRLVVTPGRDAQRILNVVSWVGGLAVGMTFIVAVGVAAVPQSEATAGSDASTAAPAPVVPPEVSPDLTETTPPASSHHEIDIHASPTVEPDQAEPEVQNPDSLPAP